MVTIEVECHHVGDGQVTREHVTYRWRWLAMAMVWLINRKNMSAEIWSARMLAQ